MIISPLCVTNERGNSFNFFLLSRGLWTSVWLNEIQTLSHLSTVFSGFRDGRWARQSVNNIWRIWENSWNYFFRFFHSPCLSMHRSIGTFLQHKRQTIRHYDQAAFDVCLRHSYRDLGFRSTVSVIFTGHFLNSFFFEAQKFLQNIPEIGDFLVSFFGLSIDKKLHKVCFSGGWCDENEDWSETEYRFELFHNIWRIIIYSQTTKKNKWSSCSYQSRHMNLICVSSFRVVVTGKITDLLFTHLSVIYCGNEIHSRFSSVQNFTADVLSSQRLTEI